MGVIWETTDRLGQPVKLTDEGWEHILDEHSDFRMDQQDLHDVITVADEIVRDRFYPHRQIHYRRYKSGRLWLRVVVQYRPSEQYGWVGAIITAHAIRNRKKDEVILWPLNTRK